MLTTHEMPPLPPNSNPFCHDLHRMGVRVGENVMVMMTNYDTDRCQHLVVVNTETGERIALVFSEPKKVMDFVPTNN